MYTVFIGEDCVSCGDCVETCLFDILTLDDGVVIVQKDACVGCQMCAEVCPTDAIVVSADVAIMEEQDAAILIDG